jgi:hypothetical protein
VRIIPRAAGQSTDNTKTTSKQQQTLRQVGWWMMKVKGVKVQGCNKEVHECGESRGIEWHETANKRYYITVLYVSNM